MVFMKRKTINLGEQSVTELTILEWKKLFSIKFFNFHKTDGKQDRFHTHAFGAVSILISGDYIEEVIDKHKNVTPLKRSRKRCLYIPANQYHRITRSSGCRTLLITGPWGSEFKELRQLPKEDLRPELKRAKLSLWREFYCGEHRKDLRKGNIEVLRGDV